MIMNKAKVIVKMIVVRHYLLVSFVICFVILLLFGDDFGDTTSFLFKGCLAFFLVSFIVPMLVAAEECRYTCQVNTSYEKVSLFGSEMKCVKLS